VICRVVIGRSRSAVRDLPVVMPLVMCPS